MNTQDIINILNSHRIHPNKKLGQNFLCNRGIVDRIIEQSSVNKNDTILEIGAGLGILTEGLVEKAGKVVAIEIDAGLAGFLNEKFRGVSSLEIRHADFLKIEPARGFTKSISNLPYYCSSEIIFRLALDYGIPEVYVMLQREMAERIASGPGSKNYGAISAVLGLYYEPDILFKIDRRSFYPQPDIDSCYMALKRKNDVGLDKDEIELYHKIVKSAFWGRRKTILTALVQSPHSGFDRAFIINILKKTDIDEKSRGEMLSVENFKNLARAVKSNM